MKIFEKFFDSKTFNFMLYTELMSLFILLLISGFSIYSKLFTEW